MIALMSDCLLFRLASGESVPFSAEMISVELVGDAAGKFDPEILAPRHGVRVSLFQKRTGPRNRHRRRICRGAGKGAARPGA